ncbi:MAG: hypothetical protein FJW30_14725 [Acidobacteria bacterium]|nr:hypothetical protein [Acidobacteriota bacterium]
MIRYIIGIVISLIAVSFIRAVVGMIQKSVKENVEDVLRDDTPKSNPAEPATAATLKRCVTCGTYKPEASMTRYGTGTKSVFFCSAACEKKAAS